MKTKLFTCIAVAALAALPAIAAAPAPAADPGWDLTDLYPSPDAWTTAHARIKADIEALTRFKGTLGGGDAALFTALDAISKARKEAYRLHVYASLKADENLGIATNQERQQLAGNLVTTLSERTSWVAPEILKLGEATIRGHLARNAELNRRFAFFLNNTLRAAPHTLGEEAEGVLAATGNLLSQPNNVYGVLADAELPYPTVKLREGGKVRLNQAAYSRYRQATSRADRKLVFDSFWSAWKTYENSFGAMLTTQVMGDVFSARARRFDNSLQAALFNDNMPEAVYRQLVTQANAGLPTLHRYLRLRRELLGIKDELRYYDIYPTIFKSSTPQKYTVADSERITLEVLKPFGEEYAAALRKGFAGKWTNYYPSTGKASGAYMNGSAYDVHPYILLNHNDDFDSLSTFAHEWGHGVHTLLATAAQPFELADYSTFTAETASIANEMLLSDHLVANAANKQDKLYYLGEALEMMRSTFFRQTLFAEFQLWMHEEVEKGGSLSGEKLTQKYCELTRRYYGEAEGVTTIDPLYCVEWAFIPHFYYGYYVYQYATSMAGAAAFTEALAKEGTPARDRFIALLKAGGSDYPYALYQKAGLDMASPAPYQALVARMNRVMDEIDALRRQK